MQARGLVGGDIAFLVDEVAVEAEVVGHLDQLVADRERPVGGLCHELFEIVGPRPEPATQTLHAVTVRGIGPGWIRQIDHAVTRIGFAVFTVDRQPVP
jgi:hypothetical protein